MILLIVGLSMLVLGAIAFCILLVIKYIIKSNQVQSNHNKVANST